MDPQSLGSLHIAVLHGGPSSEHKISVWSSSGVLATLAAAGHRVVPVYVDLQGAWHFAAGETAGATVAAPLPVLAGADHLRALGVDVAFLGFHGTYGEDGRVQALLDLAGVPFTGSGVLASAAAMDKPLARRVFRGVGIPVARAVEVVAADVAEPTAAQRTADHLVHDLGLPIVVKVPAGGSSVGVEIPRDRQALADTLLRLGHGEQVLLCEQFVAGVELTAGVVENERGDPVALPIVEIVPRHHEFFDFHAKYDATATDEIVPARISPTATKQVQALGLAAHRALECRGVSRTDVILAADGTPTVLETNTLPGLTPASLLPKAAAAAGMDYLALLHHIIAAALRDR